MDILFFTGYQLSHLGECYSCGEAPALWMLSMCGACCWKGERNKTKNKKSKKKSLCLCRISSMTLGILNTVICVLPNTVYQFCIGFQCYMDCMFFHFCGLRLFLGFYSTNVPREDPLKLTTLTNVNESTLSKSWLNTTMIITFGDLCFIKYLLDFIIFLLFKVIFSIFHGLWRFHPLFNFSMQNRLARTYWKISAMTERRFSVLEKE